MTIEDLYRVVCGSAIIRIRDYDTNNQLWEGIPDNIPVNYMHLQIQTLRAVSSKIVVHVKA